MQSRGRPALKNFQKSKNHLKKKKKYGDSREHPHQFTVV